MTNAYIIHKEITPSTETLSNLDFRRSVYNALMAKRRLEVVSKDRDEAGTSGTVVHIRGHKPHVDTNIRFASVSHLPITVASKIRCAHCSTKAHPGRTTWKCEACNVGLCLSKDRNCFRRSNQFYYYNFIINIRRNLHNIEKLPLFV